MVPRGSSLVPSWRNSCRIKSATKKKGDPVLGRTQGLGLWSFPSEPRMYETPKGGKSQGALLPWSKVCVPCKEEWSKLRDRASGEIEQWCVSQYTTPN